MWKKNFEQWKINSESCFFFFWKEKLLEIAWAAQKSHVQELGWGGGVFHRWTDHQTDHIAAWHYSHSLRQGATKNTKPGWAFLFYFILFFVVVFYWCGYSLNKIVGSKNRTQISFCDGKQNFEVCATNIVLEVSWHFWNLPQLKR